MMRPIIPKQKMNKTEAAYERELDVLKKAGEVLDYRFEGVKLRLADNTFYTPDFFVTYPDRFEVHEVKGFWRDDARVKIKIAAEMYPFFKFRAVQLKKRQWVTEEIN